MFRVLILMLSVVPLFGALTHVRTATNSITTSATTINVSFPGGTPAAGNNVVVQLAGSQDATFTYASNACTDNQSGNTYTRQIDAYNSTNGSAIFTAVNVNVSGTFTITCTSSAISYHTIFISEWSGMAITSITDGTSSATGAVDTVACGTINTTNADDVVIAAFASGNSTNTMTISAASGYTIPTNGVQTDGNCCGSGALEYKILTATGGESPTFTRTMVNNATTACVSLALKALAGAAPAQKRRSIIF